MRIMKTAYSMSIRGIIGILVSVMLVSCVDLLDLAPIDYYGSGSYWKNEAHADAYIDGIHKHLRDVAWQHTITFGELRGGTYIDGISADGSSVFNGAIISQNFDEVNTGVSKFGDLFGRITNTNLLIQQLEMADFIPEAKKDYYLGIGHGLRAFYYFDLYRIYGGVPLRLGVEVIDGELDPVNLYLPRATPGEVMTQIKSDVAKSLDYFGTETGFNPFGHGAKSYWNKAASETLAGLVYLWNAKVSTGDPGSADYHAAQPEDAVVAKQHFLNVLNDYDLSMQNRFADVFDGQNKGNSEIIFAVRFAEGEATNALGQYTYNIGTGLVNRNAYLEDGSLFDDPLRVAGASSVQRYEYKKDLFLRFDKEDSRRDATFLGSYDKDENGELVLRGTHVKKNIGIINSNGLRVWSGDFVFYRLPLVYLSLAEIANFEGDNDRVEYYMNLVRARAYGDAWDEAEYGYVAGDFTQNELAILQEKDKEFVQEGQRWWDVRRMTLTKGGTPLVFTAEGSLDGEPILDEQSEWYKVLWPLDKALLDNDDALVQTPGY